MQTLLLHQVLARCGRRNVDCFHIALLVPFLGFLNLVFLLALNEHLLQVGDAINNHALFLDLLFGNLRRRARWGIILPWTVVCKSHLELTVTLITCLALLCRDLSRALLA